MRFEFEKILNRRAWDEKQKKAEEERAQRELKERRARDQEAREREHIEYFIRYVGKLVANVLPELTDDILNGTIRHIVGIDRGGRIPALLVQRAINTVRPGLIPNVTYFRGRTVYVENGQTLYTVRAKDKYSSQPDPSDLEEERADRKKAIEEALTLHPLVPGSKVLIVDDVFQNGETLIPIVEALIAKGHEVEVLVLESWRKRSELSLPSGTKIKIRYPEYSDFEGDYLGYVSGVHKADKDRTQAHAALYESPLNKKEIYARQLAIREGQRIGTKLKEKLQKENESVEW